MKFQFQNNDFEPYQNTNVQQLEAAAYTITGVYVSYIRDVMILDDSSLVNSILKWPSFGGLC